MRACIKIEYFVEEKQYRGNTSINYPFEYDPKKYKEELTEEFKRIMNKYPELMSLNISIH